MSHEDPRDEVNIELVEAWRQVDPWGDPPVAHLDDEHAEARRAVVSVMLHVTQQHLENIALELSLESTHPKRRERLEARHHAFRWMETVLFVCEVD